VLGCLGDGVRFGKCLIVLGGVLWMGDLAWGVGWLWGLGVVGLGFVVGCGGGGWRWDG